MTRVLDLLGPFGLQVKRSELMMRILRGTFWSAAGTLGARALGLVSLIVCARVLGQKAYGELGMVQSTLGTFGAVAGFALGLTSTKYVAELRQSDPERAGRVIGMSTLFSLISGLLVTGVIIIMAPYLARRMLAAPHLGSVLIIGAPLLLFGAWNGSQAGVLAGFEAFRDCAKIQVFISVLQFPVMILGVEFGGLQGMVWGLVLIQGLTCAANGWVVRILARENKIALTFRGCLKELPLLWGFSLPAVISTLLVVPVYWALQTFLVHKSGYEEVALYTVASQWRSYLQMLPQFLSGTYLPIASSIRMETSARRKRLMLGTAGISAAICAAIALPLLFAAPLILKAYGRGFDQGAMVLRILAITAIADAANAILLQTLLAADRGWLRLISNSFWCVTVIVLGWVLIPSHGALGLALALCIGQFLHLPLQGLLIMYSMKKPAKLD